MAERAGFEPEVQSDPSLSLESASNMASLTYGHLDRLTVLNGHVLMDKRKTRKL